MQEITGAITKIERVSTGERSQMGPISASPFRIEGRTLAGPVALEISRDAARELVEELGGCCKLRVPGE